MASDLRLSSGCAKRTIAKDGTQTTDRCRTGLLIRSETWKRSGAHCAATAAVAQAGRSARRSTALRLFSKAKRRLDAAMHKANRVELSTKKGTSIPEWTLHDLRRTAATGMAKLKISPHVTDKVLNHVSGTISGVAAIYNRFEYLDERRDALDAWGRYVSDLFEPVTSTVVAIRSRS